MKSLDTLANALLQDCGAACAVRTDRDWKTVAARLMHEGEAFLTLTLPGYGAAFEQCLALGVLDSNLWPATWRVRGGAPVFLRGFLSQVFSLETGVLLDDPNAAAVLAIRQFTLAFAKLRDRCREAKVQHAYERYVEVDSEVSRDSSQLDPSVWLTEGQRGSARFVKMANRLWGPFLDALDKAVEDDFRPNHGPGAVSERLSSNGKWRFEEWSTRLDVEFPWIDWGSPSWSRYDALDAVDFRDPGAERPVRVVDVPKTQKTPRIIAVEPSYMMYVQQGILEQWKRLMDAFPLCKQVWSFTSQLPNQQLAKLGSRDGRLATLDLSDASDRVSCRHVWNLLAWHGRLYRRVAACRSRFASVRGELVELAKFASMGSALTFPLESMVFATLVFLGIEDAVGHRLTDAEITSIAPEVRVYGDDIIVPTVYAPYVVRTLQSSGLKVNASKSFLSGTFRESCGSDWFRGTYVTPVRLRERMPDSRKQAQRVIAAVSFANQLRAVGVYPRTVELVDRIVRRLIPLPWVTEDSALLGRVDPFDRHHITIDGYHSDYHVPLARGVVVSALPPVDDLDGWGALLKFYMRRGVPVDPDHLRRAGRAVTVRLKNSRRQP